MFTKLNTLSKASNNMALNSKTLIDLGQLRSGQANISTNVFLVAMKFMCDISWQVEIEPCTDYDRSDYP